ncbi:RidA family protein [Klebsiella electrica]
MSHFPQLNEVYKKFFNGKNPPARSCTAVAGLPKEALVEIEIITYIP